MIVIDIYFNTPHLTDLLSVWAGAGFVIAIIHLIYFSIIGGTCSQSGGKNYARSHTILILWDNTPLLFSSVLHGNILRSYYLN